VADLVHELKNPVAAIRAAADSLRNAPIDHARAERLSSVLADSSRRLDALVTQFLELARAESWIQKEPRAAIDLPALVSGVVTSLERPEVRFELDLPTESLEVEGVSHRIESVVRNLVDNAVSFAPKGSAVSVSVRSLGDQVELAVQDQGPGIPQEDLPRVV
jgi:two-component system sensor histidine kinase ChvG